MRHQVWGKLSSADMGSYRQIEFPREKNHVPIKDFLSKTKDISSENIRSSSVAKTKDGFFLFQNY